MSSVSRSGNNDILTNYRERQSRSNSPEAVSTPPAPVTASNRFEALKSRLRKLQYFHPFNEDSCDLVEKLLCDVLQSLENFDIVAKR